MDDTLDEEDVLMIFDHKIRTQISLSTSGRRRVSRLRYMSRTTTHD